MHLIKKRNKILWVYSFISFLKINSKCCLLKIIGLKYDEISYLLSLAHTCSTSDKKYPMYKDAMLDTVDFKSMQSKIPQSEFK